MQLTQKLSLQFSQYLLKFHFTTSLYYSCFTDMAYATFFPSIIRLLSPNICLSTLVALPQIACMEPILFHFVFGLQLNFVFTSGPSPTQSHQCRDNLEGSSHIYFCSLLLHWESRYLFTRPVILKLGEIWVPGAHC
jgi:hypothetical protein